LSIWQHIAERISTHTAQAFNPMAPGSLGGGCINTAFKLSDGVQTWFVKTNRAELLDMFEAEAAGLDALAASATIGVPQALCSGSSDGIAYIVLQYIELGHGSGRAWNRAGEQLAAMHRSTHEAFGWIRDNTIGATAQHNAWHSEWVSFWREQRLGFQLEEAARNGYGGRLQTLGERLLTDFAALIDHSPPPSLLHGDLWGGNLGFSREGEPTIYDPAVYYGDREAELAMTELFGGFSADFYAAYRNAWPIDPGYRVRRDLYNLYHVLNHLNLFGGGYGSQAERMMQRLLAEC
jgi:fructosamine-3-kinase